MKTIVSTIGRFSRAFWLAWLVKALLPAVYRKLRHRQDLRKLFNPQAATSAATIAAFFTLFKWGEKRFEGWRYNSALSAAISSVVLILEPSSVRRPWAEYLSLRVVFAYLRSLLSKDNYNRMASVGFTIAIMELMYGVVIRPECGEGLLKWLVMTGAMPSEAAMAECRQGIKDGDHDTCKCIHPKDSCIRRILDVYYNVFKTILPLNLALSLFGGFRNGQLPITDLVRSTAFSASCVTAYQVILCLHGYLVRRNMDPLPRHRYIYALFGAVASLCIFMEKAERRPEIALFVLYGVLIYWCRR